MFNPAAFVLGALFNKPKETATWRDVYQAFAELGETERIELLECIKSDPKSLPKNLTQFLVRNLEDPSLPVIMISAIDAGLIDLSILGTSINAEEGATKDETLAQIS